MDVVVRGMFSARGTDERNVLEVEEAVVRELVEGAPLCWLTAVSVPVPVVEGVGSPIRNASSLARLLSAREPCISALPDPIFLLRISTGLETGGGTSHLLLGKACAGDAGSEHVSQLEKKDGRGDVRGSHPDSRSSARCRSLSTCRASA